MNGLNILVGVLIVGMGALGMFRGFGKAVFDALGLYAALFLANALSLPLAAGVRFHSGAAINHSYAYALLFVGLGLLALVASHYVYGATLVNIGMFEGLLGLAAGLAAGMMLAHALVKTLTMADPNGQAGAMLVANGYLSNEMLGFPTYHSWMDTITGATSYRRELPNVDSK